jgi:hypothetical protein
VPIGAPGTNLVYLIAFNCVALLILLTITSSNELGM